MGHRGYYGKYLFTALLFHRTIPTLLVLYRIENLKSLHLTLLVRVTTLPPAAGEVFRHFLIGYINRNVSKIIKPPISQKGIVINILLRLIKKIECPSRRQSLQPKTWPHIIVTFHMRLLNFLHGTRARRYILTRITLSFDRRSMSKWMQSYVTLVILDTII